MKKVILALAFAVLLPPAATYALDTAVIEVQEKQYKKIDVNTVPKETMDKIKRSYGNYMIKEAYRADDGEYKFILTKDGTDLTATFTPDGDLIKIL
jgi:predicted membrane protein